MFELFDPFLNQVSADVLQSGVALEYVQFPLMSLAEGMLATTHQEVEHAPQAENVNLLGFMSVLELVVRLVEDHFSWLPADRPFHRFRVV